MLSIILLSYQSENRLENFFLTLKTFLLKKKISFELIIIDDGSTDSSYENALGLEKKIQKCKSLSVKQEL